MQRVLLLIAVWSLMGPAPLAAAVRAEASVSIRIYNYAAVPPAQMEDARTAADLIFRTTGIRLQWMNCRVPGSEAHGAIVHECAEQVHEGREFILRLVERIPADGNDASRVLALGTSMLDRQTQGGVLVTVDLFPVRRIAEGAATDPSILLGRAIAHELGHLLLGRADHPRSGLMRAFWSKDELRGVRPTDWRFSPSEAVRMRQGLLVRARAAN